MASFSSAKVNQLVDKFNAKYGEKLLCSAGELPEVERISTGIASLDDIIGGGLPTGRLTELYGTYSSGKTSTCYRIMAEYTSQNQHVLFVDAEGTYDEELAQLYGVNLEYVTTFRPEYAEMAIEQMCIWAGAGCPLIIVDSVPALTPKVVLENKNFEKADAIALLPRLLSARLPQLVALCNKSRTTVVLINQVRVKMNAGPYGDPFDTPGGYALKHLMSLIVQCSHKEWLHDEKIGQFGQRIRMRVIKSKVSKPRGETEIVIVYNKGFVMPADIPAVLDELRIEAGFRKKQVRKSAQDVLDDDDEQERIANDSE